VLGSVNLAKMVRREKVDWPKLGKAVSVGVRFLDNVVTLNKYPTKDVEKMCKANRKIGLGVMGFADMLIGLGIRYGSDEAVKQAKEIMKFIKRHAEETSVRLAREKGAFTNYKKSKLKRKRRNATLLSIAPTGSISMIAGCSSGIEPLFSVAYVRQVLGGMKLFEANKTFEQYARYRGFYSKDLMVKVSQRGTVKGVKKVPKDIQNLFVTAMDLSVDEHVKMQAAFQAEVDNAVSKTVNLVADATIGDVKKAYMLAWKSKCKGITVYRYGSKNRQVLYLGKEARNGTHTLVLGDYSGGCLHRNCNF